MGDLDVVVVGGGIVGLATAWALHEAHPRLRAAVLEKEPRVGCHQSGRNSGVLHSGIYYRPGSLKARLCVAGRADMVAFCRRYGVAHEVCGKVIVATTADEAGALRGLNERGVANGVRNVLIDAAGLRALEPEVTGLAALHVPETGIADYPGVCATLMRLLVAAGVEVRCATAVRAIAERGDGVVLAAGAEEWRARWVVTCGGLQSDLLARSTCADDGVRIVPFRGEFYALDPARRGLVRNLVYPVPDPRFPFLGVHLTRTIGGEVHAGPNAVLGLAREGYSWGAVRPREVLDLLAWPGLRRLARRYWREGVREVRRSLSKRAFTASLQRLVPAVRAQDLRPAPAGVRAQAVDASGTLLDDFAFAESARCVHVVNAPSPAATAALPIGRLVVERLARRF
ncbi:MAG TPA: L-2-hydroxyglutarate oxidase [Candidatus Binatia bacterium]|nr:L-2-hydroxyglutarate oxidase [Candidatus Binatia bacterium]